MALISFNVVLVRLIASLRVSSYLIKGDLVQRNRTTSHLPVPNKNNKRDEAGADENGGGDNDGVMLEVM